jgi:hypothetical protein
MSKGKARCRGVRKNLMRRLTVTHKKKMQTAQQQAAYDTQAYDKPQQAVSGES